MIYGFIKNIYYYKIYKTSIYFYNQGYCVYDTNLLYIVNFTCIMNDTRSR